MLVSYHQRVVVEVRGMEGGTGWPYWEGAGWGEPPLTPWGRECLLRQVPRLEGDSRRCPLRDSQRALDHRQGREAHQTMHCRWAIGMVLS